MDALSAVTATPKKLSTHVAQLTDDTKDGKKTIILLTWIGVVKWRQDVLRDREPPLIVDDIFSDLLCRLDFIVHASCIIYGKHKTYIALHSQKAIKFSTTDLFTKILKKCLSLTC